MEESGLSIRIPNWWKRRPRPQIAVTIGSSLQPRLGVSSMLDFNVKVALGDEQISEEELSELFTSGERLVCLRGQWVEVDREKLQDALNHWKQVQKSSKNGEISFIEGMRLLAGAPIESDAQIFNEEQKHWVKIAQGEALSEILRNLRNPSGLSTTNLQDLHATLRPYQNEGVNWLSLLSGLGLGACLADDMGLGKTIQILSLILLRKQQAQNFSSQPSLLIVPASLLGNWKREADRFTPSLRLFLLHPSETKNCSLTKLEENPTEYFQDFDLVITTYSMVGKIQQLSQISWDLLILDEAQAIKNAGTKQTKSIKELKSRSRIALTGTPIENRLSDLWSLFDFLNPGLLGSGARFKQYINGLQNHPDQFESLRKLVSPYILRRMKTDPTIISDLPDKTENPVYCSLTKKQAQHYKAIVDELRQSLKSVDPKQRRGLVLRTLLQLKQICNHPSQYIGNGDYLSSDSGKFERLGEICEELASRQEKVLIFTQFSEIIPALEEYLSRIFGRRGLILHGGTPIKERKELVDVFQCDSGPPFFVLSLKAGGTGLTLTAASHVIHFDRWWNPAVENQATDRAFRIGQKKNVQVHKFITQGTVEEQIDAIIASKKKLASEILTSTDEIRITELADDELLNVLALDLDRATAS
jgi:non-specific serine/threonine protein kinase